MLLRFCLDYTHAPLNCIRFLSSSINLKSIKCFYVHENIAQLVRNEFLLQPNFIAESEESALIDEIEHSISRQKYQDSHWDYAITHFRELERKNWRPTNKPVIKRLQQSTVSSLNLNQLNSDSAQPDSLVLPLIHVLDLAEHGEIKPHVDSVKFCGGSVAVLSLLSDAILRLAVAPSSEIVGVPVNRTDLQTLSLPVPGSFVDLVVPRRSLYIMRGASRYLFTHAILSNNQVGQLRHEFGQDLYGLHRGRRISVICRTKVIDKLEPWVGNLSEIPEPSEAKVGDCGSNC